MAHPSLALRGTERLFAVRVPADCWETPQSAGRRRQPGKVSFTDQRVVFAAASPDGAPARWEVELEDVASVQTCMVPPFRPWGVRLCLRGGGHYTLGIPNRSRFVDWLSQQIRPAQE